MLSCSICGGNAFSDRVIIWDLLAKQWQLSPFERDYIDRQQGTCCTSCGANLRSMALAKAIRNALKVTGTLKEFASSNNSGSYSILEINKAGSLNEILRLFRGHILAGYPEIDIHSLPYAENQFDLVVHSDTLEHVDNPIHALAECRRVLKPGGWLCYTVPVITGRLTRSRAGLEKSFHANAADTPDDFLVHTEFGADMWTYAVQAGFTEVTITVLEFPSALALSACKR